MHPLLNQRKNIKIYLLTWILIAACQILFLHKGQNIAIFMATVDGLIFSGLYAIMGFSLWYPCRYLSGEKIALAKVIENHTFASISSSGLWLAAGYLSLAYLFPDDDNYHQFLQGSLIERGVLGVFYYVITISIYHIFILSERLRERVRKETELKVLVAEAELRSLKFQVNPHFIFNSLNSINSLTMTNPEKAGEMTIKLAEFLRYTLSKSDENNSLLREEIGSMKLYLDIEKIRFGNKIKYSENCSRDCQERYVPSMILQPLFENAIKHGVYESLEPVEINLTCERDGDFLKICLKNEFDPDGASRKGEGIGLRNIRQRLEKMYNHDNLLNLEKKHDRFSATIFIPMEETS